MSTDPELLARVLANTQAMNVALKNAVTAMTNANALLVQAQLMRTTVTLVGGQELHNAHPEGSCVGEDCPIHRPSFHHMRTWHQRFTVDRQVYVPGVANTARRYMWRVCMHGELHIDPDEPFWLGDRCPCVEQVQCCIPPRSLTIVDVSDKLGLVSPLGGE